MAIEYIWPLDLPQVPTQDDWSVTPQLPVKETTMDSGPAKRRLAYSKGMEYITVGYILELDELARWHAFLKHIAYGALSFKWPDPRVNKRILVNIKPQTVKEESLGMFTHLTFTLEAW